MTEPLSGAALSVTAAGGIAVFGVVTGLEPALLLAGAAGGWWSLSYMYPLSILARIHHIALSALIAAWVAPAADVPGGPYVAALVVGLVAVPVLGKALMKLAGRKLDAEEGKQ